MEFSRDLASLSSLALTVPTLFGCAGVIWLWHKSAWAAWKAQHRTEVHWFVLGVVIGFTGALVDNLYWGLAWLSDFLEWPIRDDLFSNGVYSNVFFRQVSTAFAAACHVRAAVMTSSTAFRVSVYLSWALVPAVSLVLFVLHGEG